MEFKHIPVLLEECIDALKINSKGTYVDGTLGGGGHSLQIAKRLDNEGLLIANDRDVEALEAGKARLKDYSDRVKFIHGNYKDIPKKLPEKVDGILLDLGISSYQIDNAERGFSYINDAKLDMRMDKSQALTAEDVINTYSQRELSTIIRKYGEENFANRIANNIVVNRANSPIDTTSKLAKIIEDSYPAKFRWAKGHPAKKTFQAIRIEVNDELSGLYECVIDLARCLKPDGRLAIITFHSLEDRIVKNAYKYLEQDCICDKNSPICTCDKRKEIKILTKKPLIPTEKELEMNSRAKSSKLRILKKL